MRILQQSITVGSTRQDLRLTTIVVTSVFIIAGLIVSAVGNNSVTFSGYSAVLYCAAICIGVQWLAWIPASMAKTERFYDLTGGLTYLTVVGFSLWAGSQSEAPSLRELIVSLLVVIWALRLSSFLYLRIHRTGKDGRFDQLKTSPIRFLVPWTIHESHRSPTAVSRVSTLFWNRSKFVVSDKSDSILAAKVQDCPALVTLLTNVSAIRSPSITW